MKIAALIVAHHNSQAFNNLTKRLSGELWSIYAHIDSKAIISDFQTQTLKIHFLNERYSVTWGGFSQVLVSISLLRRAISDVNNTHFYLMSGQCYPILTDDQIESAIRSNEHQNYIDLQPFPHPTKPATRLTRHHYVDVKPKFLGTLFRHVSRIIKPTRSIQSVLRDIEGRSGASWWLLERQSVEAILRFLDENPWVIEAFRHSKCGDEIFFNSLFYHLKLCANNPCPTAALWIGGDPNPRNIDYSNCLLLKTDGRLFARKFCDHNSVQDIVRVIGGTETS